MVILLSAAPDRACSWYRRRAFMLKVVAHKEFAMLTSACPQHIPAAAFVTASATAPAVLTTCNLCKLSQLTACVLCDWLSVSSRRPKGNRGRFSGRREWPGRVENRTQGTSIAQNTSKHRHLQAQSETIVHFHKLCAAGKHCQARTEMPFQSPMPCHFIQPPSNAMAHYMHPLGGSPQFVKWSAIAVYYFPPDVVTFKLKHQNLTFMAYFGVKPWNT